MSILNVNLEKINGTSEKSNFPENEKPSILEILIPLKTENKTLQEQFYVNENFGTNQETKFERYSEADIILKIQGEKEKAKIWRETPDVYPTELAQHEELLKYLRGVLENIRKQENKKYMTKVPMFNHPEVSYNLKDAVAIKNFYIMSENVFNANKQLDLEKRKNSVNTTIFVKDPLKFIENFTSDDKDTLESEKAKYNRFYNSHKNTVNWIFPVENIATITFDLQAPTPQEVKTWADKKAAIESTGVSTDIVNQKLIDEYKNVKIVEDQGTAFKTILPANSKFKYKNTADFNFGKLSLVQQFFKNGVDLQKILESTMIESANKMANANIRFGTDKEVNKQSRMKVLEQCKTTKAELNNILGLLPATAEQDTSLTLTEPAFIKHKGSELKLPNGEKVTYYQFGSKPL